MTNPTPLGPRPKREYWDAGNAHGHMAISGVYVEWLERALAESVGLLEELTNFKSQRSFAQIAADVHAHLRAVKGE